jgi:hypothetical protein
MQRIKAVGLMIEITEAYIEEIKQKIKSDENGDVDLMILSLVYANYTHMMAIESNAAVKFGSFVKQNKVLVGVLGFIVYVLAILVPELALRLLGVDVSKFLPP